MTDPTPIRATPELVRALPKVPWTFRVAADAALRLAQGRLIVTLPDGRRLLFDGGEPGPDAAITLNNWRLPGRMMAGGALGVAESYIDGDWDTPDLAEMLSVWSLNMDAVLGDLSGSAWVRIAHKLYHALRPNSRAGARKNIYAHYDLGNAFYEAWLDPSMTYSSALFEGPARNESLEAAQRAKYAALADKLELNENSHVLEIGCGWGGFAEYAAKERGARVTGLTISKAQHDFACERIASKQLSHKVDIKLQDYRDETGQYDGVASIEMFEAVGERYWPAFFSKVNETLKPGKRAALQIITIDDALFDEYRRTVDFIQRYIFPGGMLPSALKLKEAVANAGLTWKGAAMFGGDYAETLKRWRLAFEERWSDILAMSDRFNERFRRMWRYYLAYCEAGFATGRIDVGQFTLAKA